MSVFRVVLLFREIIKKITNLQFACSTHTHPRCTTCDLDPYNLTIQLITNDRINFCFPHDWSENLPKSSRALATRVRFAWRGGVRIVLVSRMSYSSIRSDLNPNLSFPMIHLPFHNPGKAQCPYPGDPPNGLIAPLKFHYDPGDYLTVQCRPGFVEHGVNGGPPERPRCTPEGDWSGPVPQCRSYEEI